MNENKYPLVSNPRDLRFLTFRSPQTPQGRSRTGLYVIEGIQHLARAVEHNAAIESVFLDPSVLSNLFGSKTRTTPPEAEYSRNPAFTPILPRPDVGW